MGVERSGHSQIVSRALIRKRTAVSRFRAVPLSRPARARRAGERSTLVTRRPRPSGCGRRSSDQFGKQRTGFTLHRKAKARGLRLGRRPSVTSETCAAPRIQPGADRSVERSDPSTNPTDSPGRRSRRWSTSTRPNAPPRLLPRRSHDGHLQDTGPRAGGGPLAATRAGPLRSLGPMRCVRLRTCPEAGLPPSPARPRDWAASVAPPDVEVHLPRSQE